MKCVRYLQHTFNNRRLNCLPGYIEKTRFHIIFAKGNGRLIPSGTPFVLHYENVYNEQQNHNLFQQKQSAENNRKSDPCGFAYAVERYIRYITQPSSEEPY